MVHRVQLNPVGWMSQVSPLEIEQLEKSASENLYTLFRSCCLAVLNSGVESDDCEQLFAPYEDFDVTLIRNERGVKIELWNPPSVAFVDGKLIRGVHEHLFAVLRDILFYQTKHPDMVSEQPSQMVFDMLRHADLLTPDARCNTIVCWGGHSIKDHEYRYSKEVGYQLGLREFDICTGCGPGAMKGPMKGATIGHAKQRLTRPRYVGLSEPTIIAAEPPNAMVNQLLILPDIEKRLEAFVRLASGILVFPGGVGTAEEILYLLGILLDERNANQSVPLIFTGPRESETYFASLDQFIGNTLGPEARQHYSIIIDDPKRVAEQMKDGRERVMDLRRALNDSYAFNWSLVIDPEFQQPFEPTHETMAKLNLSLDQPRWQLASALRKAFSGIVAGNVKTQSIERIRSHGPFQLSGDAALMQQIDQLLQSFTLQGRMKLPGSYYHPCYEIDLG